MSKTKAKKTKKNRVDISNEFVDPEFEALPVSQRAGIP